MGRRGLRRRPVLRELADADCGVSWSETTMRDNTVLLVANHEELDIGPGRLPTLVLGLCGVSAPSTSVTRRSSPTRAVERDAPLLKMQSPTVS